MAYSPSLTWCFQGVRDVDIPSMPHAVRNKTERTVSDGSCVFPIGAAAIKWWINETCMTLGYQKIRMPAAASAQVVMDKSGSGSCSVSSMMSATTPLLSAVMAAPPWEISSANPVGPPPAAGTSSQHARQVPPRQKHWVLPFTPNAFRDTRIKTDGTCWICG